MESDALVVIVIGKIEAAPNNIDKALRLSLQHVKRSRTELGCIEHNVSVDPEDNSKFIFVEYWVDMPALMAHFALETSQKFVAALTPLLAQKAEMKIYQADEVPAG